MRLEAAGMAHVQGAKEVRRGEDEVAKGRGEERPWEMVEAHRFDVSGKVLTAMCTTWFQHLSRSGLKRD